MIAQELARRNRAVGTLLVNPVLMLLANPIHAAASAAKCDVRVLDRATSFNHATVRVMFMAAAVKTFWRWVRANPIYRGRRMSSA